MPNIYVTKEMYDAILFGFESTRVNLEIATDIEFFEAAKNTFKYEAEFMYKYKKSLYKEVARNSLKKVGLEKDKDAFNEVVKELEEQDHFLCKYERSNKE